MIAGELDFVATGCPELFRAKRQGFDLRVVGDFAPVNVYLIASRKEISDPKQLATGKKSASINSWTHLMSRRVLPCATWA